MYALVAVLGAFSLVRFRSLQGTSREIGFIFFAMTVGITCSIGHVVFAILITAIVCGIHFLLQKIHFGESKTREKELKITIPENLDYTGFFDEIRCRNGNLTVLLGRKDYNPLEVL